MSNKQDRENKELQNCIKDPRYARQFWRSVGTAIANRPAVRTPTTLDKDGNETSVYYQLDVILSEKKIEEQEPIGPSPEQ